jgi:hypothetical protein
VRERERGRERKRETQPLSHAHSPSAQFKTQQSCVLGRRPKKQIATKRYRVRSWGGTTTKDKEKEQESLEERPERAKAKEEDGQEGVSS